MGGLHRAFERAYSLRCSTFQIFTTNPRGWKQREVSQEEVGAFLEESKRTGIDLYFSHIPYLANFAAEGEIFEKSVHMLHAELQRSFKLKIAGVVVHVGKLKGKAYKEGIRKIARGIDLAMEGRRMFWFCWRIPRVRARKWDIDWSICRISWRHQFSPKGWDFV